MLPGTGESYWLETAPPPDHPTLGEDLQVDVAVVGGGIAGLCTAWELAAAGRRVAVLEAGRIAASVTGYTTAKLSALHTLTYSSIRSSFGSGAAQLYARSQQAAVDRAFELADELGIECELERVPAYTFAATEKTLDKVRAEADAAAEAGLDAAFVTETGLPFAVAGAVRVEGQAQFHPRKFLLGLARDVVGRGGRIFENTRVVGLAEGEPARLTTERGQRVTAEDVVVATHYPVFDRALMFSRLEPTRELVLAGPIAAEHDPAGTYISPEENTRSVRTAPYRERQRLLIVTGEHFTPGTADVEERFGRLLAWTREHFPGVELTHRWATQDNSTTDGVPYIGPFHPMARHVYVATGFGGWGMSTGIVAGRLLAAAIAGERLPWTDLYDPRRFSPRRDLPSTAKLQATVARHFVGDRLRAGSAGSPEQVPAGSGAIVRHGTEQWAVYRDDDGVLHTLSARCTHLGCLVAFNDAERAWECPCHGSRFDVDGAVLQGPANRPLPRKEPGD